MTVAFYTLAGGTVGALLAAIPGFIDSFGIENPKTKAMVIWHMTINLLAVALYCVNFWLRLHRAPGDNLPLLLSIIGVGMIVISGLARRRARVRPRGCGERAARPKRLITLRAVDIPRRKKISGYL